jgi:dolichyl-phosphate beta-glucosyltransferase
VPDVRFAIMQDLTPVSNPTLALIVPCHNEAARLKPPAFLQFISSHPSVSFVFVDDGSSDATFEILERLRQAAPASIALMRLPTNQGKAEAVRVGILEGIRRNADLVGFWDADLPTPLTAVDDFLALAVKRPEIEIILGSRVNLMGRHIRRKPWRHYLGRVFATAVSLALDLPVYDTQCGAKVFRTSQAVAAVFPKPFDSRWIFDVEILARYLAQPAAAGDSPRQARIYELVIPAWHDVPGSKLRWFHYFRATFDLARVWRARHRAAKKGAAESAGAE